MIYKYKVYNILCDHQYGGSSFREFFNELTTDSFLRLMRLHAPGSVLLKPGAEVFWVNARIGVDLLVQQLGVEGRLV